MLLWVFLSVTWITISQEPDKKQQVQQIHTKIDSIHIKLDSLLIQFDSLIISDYEQINN